MGYADDLSRYRAGQGRRGGGYGPINAKNPPKDRVYEQNLIDPYLRPQRQYESDIIAANTKHPSVYETKAGQGRAGGGYGPILAQNDQGYDVLSGPKTGSKRPVGNGGSGGSGTGGGFGGTIEEPPPIEEPIDPSIAAQAEFIKRMMGYRDETMAGYPVAAGNIGKYYDTASADLADPYNDYYNQYREGANNVGLDFANDDNVKLADLAARKLQENYDLNETTDLATVEKMKSLNKDSFTNMLMAADARQIGPGLLADQIKLAQETALAEAAAEALANGGGGGGGGGGGRGGGGSGGGSDPFSIKSTQEEALFNQGLADSIYAMTDPDERAYADFMYSLSGTNPQTMLTNLAKDKAKFAAFKPPAATTRGISRFMSQIRNKSATAKNDKRKRVNQNVYRWAQGQSAGYVPQIVSNKVSTSSTNKNG